MSVYLLAALFLPLFPLSMVFNRVLASLRPAFLKAAVLVLWPQVGVWLLALGAGDGHALAAPPQWLMIWALCSSLLYAWRAIAINEAGLWTGFLASSCWALLWLAGSGLGSALYSGADSGEGTGVVGLSLMALGFSLPLALLALLTGGIERRFGAAHIRANPGLANTAPRYAGLWVLTLLAALATPVFPGFFIMIAIMTTQADSGSTLWPLMLAALALIWLLWSWSGARLLQGIVIGEGRQHAVEDMGIFRVRLAGMTLLGLAGAGIWMSGWLL